MNWKKASALLTLSVCSVVFFNRSLTVSHAEDVEAIQQQEGRVSQEITQLESEINQKAADIADQRVAIDQLQQQIEQLEQEKQTTEQHLAAKEKEKVARVADAERRMQILQTEAGNMDWRMALFSAESISDVFARFEAASDFQSAATDQIALAQQIIAESKQLSEQLNQQTAQLVMQKEALTTQSAQLASEIDGLNRLISDNRAQLDQLAAQRLAAQRRIEEELAKQQAVLAKQAEEAAAQKASESAIASTPAPTPTPPAASSPQPAQPAPSTPVATGGRTLTVNATAYSYTQPGLSYFTADGTDLRVNPQVIAVDPRVIPLGSYVSIPGYGVFLAADTGGDIKGNRIDIHMLTTEAALQFGRRNLTITILE